MLRIGSVSFAYKHVPNRLFVLFFIADLDPKEIIDGYEQGVPNTHSRNEIILDCPYYYLLNLEAFLNMLGGDVFSVNEPDYKIISDEVLDRMNTYDDVIKVLNSTPS